ncbi:MAG TPA: Npt1/Npt2 family nucleotide transporter, partial [Anaerolineales bacterium]|nr:Npt1/Npt2 family nucleotide transporter [Anaerolineales bacterium]
MRPQEVALVALTAGMFAAVQAGQGLGANTADALLFRRFGVEALPLLFIVLGGATFVVTLAYSAALSRVDPSRLSAWLLAGSAGLLIVARAAAAVTPSALYPVLWLLVGLTGALIGTLIWNIAGDLFDARQSKRLFPLLASSGILGSVVGNLMTGSLARSLGTENLLLVDAGLLSMAALLVRPAWRQRAAVLPRRRRRPSLLAELRSGHDYVMRSRLMRLTAAAAILFSVAFFLVTYPFSRAVALAFPDEASLAGYLGRFSGLVTAVTFVVSSFVASRLYARVGVVNSVLILPVIYLAGFVLWLVRFDLATAAAFRFAQLTVLGGLAGAAYNALF